MKTYILEGGVGKHIAFTSVIKELVARDKDSIIIYTPYPYVFANNPDVKLVIDANTNSLSHPDIQASEDVIFVEPYKSSWVKGGEHIVDAYVRLLGLKGKKLTKPVMYTDEHAEDTTKILEQLDNRKFIVIQLTGGQATPTYVEGQQYVTSMDGRNYHPYLGQELVNKLAKEYPDHAIVNWSLPNETQFEGAIPANLTPYQMHELLKHADAFVSIDSSLQHIAQSAGVQGIVIWGSTNHTQFGYTDNINMTFHEGEYNLADPRNTFVEPSAIIDSLKTIIKE